MSHAYRTWAIIFIIIGMIFIFTGFEKKNVYENSDSAWGNHTNAYVGGDAYNYIINGTYFTGYVVMGSLFIVAGTVFFVGAGIGDFKLKQERDMLTLTEKLQEQNESVRITDSGIATATENTKACHYKLGVKALSDSLQGINLINGILHVIENNKKFGSAKISVGGTVTSGEKIDGLLCYIRIVDIFDETVLEKKLSFVNLQCNGQVFLTEAIPIEMSEHDVSRTKEVYVKVINYSKNRKKVLTYTKDQP